MDTNDASTPPTPSGQPIETVEFDDVLEGRIANGVYPLGDKTSAADLAARAGSGGWRLLHLDCSSVTTKGECLAAWRTAGDFPDWVGNNWDALNDALTDLSWLHAEGYVVLLDHGATFRAASPGDAALAEDILRDSANAWSSNGTPFVVLTR